MRVLVVLEAECLENNLCIDQSSPSTGPGLRSEINYMVENGGLDRLPLPAHGAEGSERQLAASVKTQNDKRGLTLNSQVGGALPAWMMRNTLLNSW